MGCNRCICAANDCYHSDNQAYWFKTDDGISEKVIPTLAAKMLEAFHLLCQNAGTKGVPRNIMRRYNPNYEEAARKARKQRLKDDQRRFPINAEIILKEDDELKVYNKKSRKALDLTIFMNRHLRNRTFTVTEPLNEETGMVEFKYDSHTYLALPEYLERVEKPTNAVRRREACKAIPERIEKPSEQERREDLNTIYK